MKTAALTKLMRRSFGRPTQKLTKEGDKFTAKNVYSEDVTKNMVNHHGGVVLVDGHIYGYSDGKGWVCQDAKTGKILWHLNTGGLITASPMTYMSEGKQYVAIASYSNIIAFGLPDQAAR